MKQVQKRWKFYTQELNSIFSFSATFVDIGQQCRALFVNTCPRDDAHVAVALLICVREIFGSSLGLDNGNPDGGAAQFCSVRTGFYFKWCHRRFLTRPFQCIIKYIRFEVFTAFFMSIANPWTVRIASYWLRTGWPGVGFRVPIRPTFFSSGPGTKPASYPVNAASSFFRWGIDGTPHPIATRFIFCYEKMFGADIV
jgi:hypothetical protein